MTKPAAAGVRRSPQEEPARLIELAKAGALAIHIERSNFNEFLDDLGTHVFVEDADDRGFSICPHPDCKLVNSAAPVCTRCEGRGWITQATFTDHGNGQGSGGMWNEPCPVCKPKSAATEQETAP